MIEASVFLKSISSEKNSGRRMMKLFHACLLVVVSMACCITTHAASVEDYGKLPSIDYVRISPDGQHIAYFSKIGEQRVVTIHDLSGKTKLISLDAGKASPFDLSWAGNEYLVTTVVVTSDVPARYEGPKQRFALASVYELATGKMTALQTRFGSRLNTVFEAPVVRMIGGEPIIYFQPFSMVNNNPNEQLAARLAVYSYNPKTDVTREVVAASYDVYGFVLDPEGRAVARLFSDIKNTRIEIWRGDKWEAVYAPPESSLDDPRLLGLGRTDSTLWVTRPKQEAQLEDTSGQYETREIRLADASWVADATFNGGQTFIRDAVTGLVIGHTKRSHDKATFVFDDLAMQKNWAAIEKAFPGEQVEYVSMSGDHKKIVVSVFGKVNGAAYMLVDLNTGQAGLIGDKYENLPPEAIASVSAIAYPATDGLQIPAYLRVPQALMAQKNLPLIVLPHGGPAARDTADFYWLAQALAGRGYAVLQPQYRGSGGYGESFRVAGFGQWGHKMQTDLSDGVRFLAASKLIDPRRVCIVGMDYGGYAALAGVTLEQGIYQCAVSYAGYTDFENYLAWLRKRNPSSQANSLNRVRWNRFLGGSEKSEPSLSELSPVRQADKASAPVLLIHGEEDTRIPYQQSQLMAEALRKAGKPVELVVLKGEDHDLTHIETRLQMLQATMRFVEANNPPDLPMPVATSKP